MIWNPWKRIKELERELRIDQAINESDKRVLQQALQAKDKGITMLEEEMALLIAGEIDKLKAKIDARIGVDALDYNNRLRVMLGMQNQYNPRQSSLNRVIPSSINAITGSIF